MRVIRTAIIVAGVLTLLVSFCSCNTLALSGPKKYKVDLSNLLLAVKDEIENKGAVTDKTASKFESFLESNREEFGAKGSFIRSSEALDSIKESQSLAAEGKDAAAFQSLQEAKQSIYSAQDMLKTEVKE